MHKLLRCRRGSVAFATVAALVPLIGAVALGAEAGSWYVTKQRAQNAADAAAYSGAVRVACTISGGVGCDTAQDYVYRGKQFAAQNSFCATGDSTAYPGRNCVANLPSGISQTVQINLLASWKGAPGNFVQANVSQQQPGYLAQLLGFSTVNIPATAVAKVQIVLKPPCVLALTGTFSFQGSPNINAPNCGLASNDPDANAINFTGGGMSMNVGSLSAVGGCTGAASFCNLARTYTAAPIANPFAPLDGALTTMCGANPALPASCGLPVCSGSGFVAYTAATPCTNDGLHITSNGTITLSGIYFISGTLKITGGPTISGPATFILLPGAVMNNQGNATFNMTEPTTAPSTSSLPTSLQPYANLFQGMAMYDSSASPIRLGGGNANINLQGNIYAPNAAVTFQGNPTFAMSGGQCGQLVAASIAFNGNATFDSTGCPSATKLPNDQYVQLVQ